MSQYVSPKEYRDEVFTGDDSGPHIGAFWVAANDRSASEAAVMVEGVVGPFEQGVQVDLVSGYVTAVNGEQRFTKGDDDCAGFWEVYER